MRNTQTSRKRRLRNHLRLPRLLDIKGEGLAQAMPDAEIYDVSRYGSVKR